MSTITDSLEKAGFEPSIAKIYTILVESGELTVGAIIEKSQLSRAGAYDALNLLLAQGYIEYRKEGRNAFYKPVHPDKLFNLVEEKKRETAQLEDEVKEAVKALAGAFNLTQNKPGVRFFEGKDGMIQAYESILDIGQPIDSFEDSGEMVNFFPEYVKKYVQRRIENKITNRSIVPDTNKINEPDPTKFIDSCHLPANEFPFNMDIKICANTVQIATLKEGQAVAIQIEHKIISENFRTLFNYIWNKNKKTIKPPSD